MMIYRAKLGAATLTGMIVMPPLAWERPCARPFPIYVPPATAALTALDGRCCRWPIGEVEHEGFRFCAAPRERGPYCAVHRRLAVRRRR